MQYGYSGIKFPFSFNSKGGVQMSYANNLSTDLINESITQRLFTKKFDRTMEPHIFSDIDYTLFKNLDEGGKTLLIYYIVQALMPEDRIVINSDSVTINKNLKDNSFDINITYFFKLTSSYHSYTINIKEDDYFEKS